MFRSSKESYSRTACCNLWFNSASMLLLACASSKARYIFPRCLSARVKSSLASSERICGFRKALLNESSASNSDIASSYEGTDG